MLTDLSCGFDGFEDTLSDSYLSRSGKHWGDGCGRSNEVFLDEMLERGAGMYVARFSRCGFEQAGTLDALFDTDRGHWTPWPCVGRGLYGGRYERGF